VKSILILILLAFGCAAQAQDLAASALKRIAGTPFFAFGGVGFAGHTSKGEADFHVLMAQPSEAALQSFEKLYATGNTEAKAYALAGIRELNLQEFNQLLGTLQHSGEKISTMEGCIIEQRSLTEVATNFKSGKYDYWIRRHRGDRSFFDSAARRRFEPCHCRAFAGAAGLRDELRIERVGRAPLVRID
jgi:hypothetical protein